jgi:hypothetical protein
VGRGKGRQNGDASPLHGRPEVWHTTLAREAQEEPLMLQALLVQQKK